MWMMGYSDGGEFNMPDSFSGRKLKPLIPRTPPVPSPNNTSNSSPPRLGRIHGNDFFSLNHHLATMADQSKRDFHAQSVVVSSRWNPTPEQLRTLEELYRRGTRTPSAEQIQHITAQLRRYGKIEGKNVFYWFQNHKARERQKRRRQMESAAPDHQQQNRDIEIFETKESGASRTTYEGEQTKNWAPSTNCSTLPEEAMSIQRAAKGVVAECRGDGWIQYDEVELQHRRNFMERNDTWQMMQLSCPSPTHLINASSGTCTITTTTTTATILAGAEATSTVVAGTIRTMDPNRQLIKTHTDLNIFIAPYIENNIGPGLINHFSNEEDHNGYGDSHQTLQLFPLRNNGGESINDKETETSSAVAAAMNANFTTPYQFFEFLPLKN
ncbi:hypothetical protein P3X46_022271 [Hevea brasiliensis]|uniref:Uncharacterized protein n=2 Tax=Hevea brasiliensis TaxID=3981 RepID=A0ABQ9L941_HEVBR|nr:WUSCHEL-related homeobox 1 [Hevea brasiliensis]KAF2317472.1 hypothetical protein GH714_022604 [Hevea brasiliensis]KAJ9162504.1 hypothetical protein P3X46_022271 [Hevea brasiliensis]